MSAKESGAWLHALPISNLGLRRCHSVEVKQLNLRLADTRDMLSSRVGEVEAELRAAQQLISSKNSALSDRDNEVAKLTHATVDSIMTNSCLRKIDS